MRKTRLPINFRVIFCLLSLTFFMLACDKPAPSHGVNQADTMAVQYMQAIKDKKYSQASALYGLEVRQQALDKIKQTSSDLGGLRTFTLASKEVNTVFSGKFFIYEFDTEYEAYSKVNAEYTRYSATDILTVFYDLSKKRLSVVSHMVDSDGLR